MENYILNVFTNDIKVYQLKNLDLELKSIYNEYTTLINEIDRIKIKNKNNEDNKLIEYIDFINDSRIVVYDKLQNRLRIGCNNIFSNESFYINYYSDIQNEYKYSILDFIENELKKDSLFTFKKISNNYSFLF